MKLKKFISGGLAVGLLLNSAPISFASILSEDGRYETFEGNNIAIDNILEEDKVDVEIEGNTLVNLIGDEFYVNNISTTVLNQDKSIIFEQTQVVTDKRTQVNFNKAIVDVDKTYTLFFNIIENTLCRQDSNTMVGKFNIVNYSSGTHVIKQGDIGMQKIVLKQPNNATHNGMPYLEIAQDALGKLVVNNIMLLEGDFSDYDIPYFEGMKSVGQDDVSGHKIEVLSSVGKENLIKDSDVYIERFNTAKTFDSSYQNLINRIQNNTITISVDIEVEDMIPREDGRNRVGCELSVIYEDNTKDYMGVWYTGENFKGRKSRTYTVGKKIKSIGYLGIYIQCDGTKVKVGRPKIEIGNVGTNWCPSPTDNLTNLQYFINKIEIPLVEPLRGIPSGAKDRIVRKNGQWVVERNCKEIVLDGSEDWGIRYYPGDNFNKYIYHYILPKKSASNNDFDIKAISDKFPYDNSSQAPSDWSIKITGDGERLIFRTDINMNSIEKLRGYLNSNPIKVVYKLESPIYEPLHINSTINTYLDATHISNSSNIPANMKITINRTMNRAIEAIEVAKNNPTVSNISEARYWTNLLKESIKKDELQNEINIITNIEDLKLEEKTATANLDIYIKSENMLSMSLSTNSITFNNYSGVEDMSLDNAINISINSSLPYQINSYLLTEMENSDKSSVIEKDLLNIKSSSNIDYKTFVDIDEKLVLEDDCEAGNNKSHSVDLMLKGSNAHKADVYKTTIKFEAEQK